MDRAVSDSEKEQRMAIFVMKNFVPDEQKDKVDLDFIMLQLRRSPILPQFGIRTYYSELDQGKLADGMEIDENSVDWKDLMQWSRPSLLDTIESSPVHLFQWERSYKFLVELLKGLRGMTAPSSRLESQRKEIRRIFQLLREKRSTGRIKVDTTTSEKKPKNVCCILWKLRGFLATIPTPETSEDSVSAHIRLLKFHEELGIIAFTKINQWLYKDPEQYLLYLATVCWFPEVNPVQPAAQDRT